MVGAQLKLGYIEVSAGCDANECSYVIGHTIRLEQVFLNIISNARDAILKFGQVTGRKITITAENVPGGARLAITLPVADELSK